jgi:transketolase
MNEKIEKLKDLTKVIRGDILKMLQKSASGHTGGSLSCVEILTALFFHKMKHFPDNPQWEDRDKFVMSKGHGAPALYSALARSGYFGVKELDTLRQVGSILRGHPFSKVTPGVEVCSGSLGQGLSQANGLAIAARMDNRKTRVYVLLGDGEIQEGQIWEAAMTSAHYKIDNICCIIDNNGLQIDGKVADIKSVEPILAKWSSFGWNTLEVDGHNLEEIIHALDKAEEKKGVPTLILANTVKGKGVSFMEGKVGYHGVPPSWEELQKASEEIGFILEEKDYPKPELPMKKGPEVELLGTREMYGQALAELGVENPNIVVLDADLSGSTKSGVFGKKFPGRFFNMGVAEQDMMGTAAGFAAAGKIVFASTFAIFATGRAWEQIRQSIAFPGFNVKIVASHGGLTVGEDGASHQALEDIGLMRGLANMKVIVPADGYEAASAVREAVRTEGPVYIRTSREKFPVLYNKDHKFIFGKAIVQRQGKDIAIIAIGLMVHFALEAARILEAEGIECTVINSSSVKPLDVETITKAARETGAVVTVEEHSIYNGLGSAVAEALSEECPVPMKMIGVRDKFGMSGPSHILLEKYGLNAHSIAAQVRDFLSKKNGEIATPGDTMFSGREVAAGLLIS